MIFSLFSIVVSFYLLDICCFALYNCRSLAARFLSSRVFVFKLRYAEHKERMSARQFASEIIESETENGRSRSERKNSTENENGIKIFMSLCVTGLSFELAFFGLHFPYTTLSLSFFIHYNLSFLFIDGVCVFLSASSLFL